jgi:hypothetical protein
MVRRVRFSIVAVAVVAGVAVTQGCGHENKPPAATSQTQVTSVPVQHAEPSQSPVTPMEDDHPVAHAGASGDALFRLASVRCDRELSCGNVGRSSDYSSRDDCLVQKLDHVRRTYRAAQCPGGIDKDKLDTCVATIRTTRCEADIGEPEYLTPCGASVLCLP